MILFETKVMGNAFYLPFIGFLLALGQIFWGKDSDLSLLFWSLEFIVTPLSSWWTVFLFYEYYEEEAAELLFSYPISAFKHGLGRILVFLSGYIVLFISLLAVASLADKGAFLVLIVQYIPETLLFSGFAFLAAVIVRNIFVPLIIIIFYITTEFFTKGSLIPWYHAMFFNTSPVQFQDIWSRSLTNLVISVVLMLLGHLYLSKRKRS
ncbi:hypothetical protein [Lentibacillus kimchii]